MIVRKEVDQLLWVGHKRQRDGKYKEVELMHVAEHILGVVNFSVAGGEGVETSHDYAQVIKSIIHKFQVKNVLVDDGSKVNLLPYRSSKPLRSQKSTW